MSKTTKLLTYSSTSTLVRARRLIFFFAYTEFSLLIQKHNLTSVAEYLRHCCTSAHLRFALGTIDMTLISSNVTNAMACTVYPSLGDRGGEACVTSIRRGITDSVRLHGVRFRGDVRPAVVAPRWEFPAIRVTDKIEQA